jgi:threonine synthase
VRNAEFPDPTCKALLATRPLTMWRYREWLPLEQSEYPITLGEGGTPLRPAPALAQQHGFGELLIKDEGISPTGSFKARGIALAVTRAVRGGARRLVIATAGSAGLALSAYAAQAGVPIRVYAPQDTPPAILKRIPTYGAELVLVDGHIGECGRAARVYAGLTGAVDLSTLREPYRIEGKKTLGFELAEQLDWSFPDAIVYPTGGGTGLIGMWKAFDELTAAGWVRPNGKPRMHAVQASGCAPVVSAFRTGSDRCVIWSDPRTIASGLRVPQPFGDRLILRTLRESCGTALALTDDSLQAAAEELRSRAGVDASPEGGAALAGAIELRRAGVIGPRDRVVVFNTGAGWLHRS